MALTMGIKRTLGGDDFSMFVGSSQSVLAVSRQASRSVLAATRRGVPVRFKGKGGARAPVLCHRL